jgi:hypothetical protein
MSVTFGRSRTAPRAWGNPLNLFPMMGQSPSDMMGWKKIPVTCFHPTRGDTSLRIIAKIPFRLYIGEGDTESRKN